RQGLCRGLPVRVAGAQRDPVRQVARVRPRGHGALLRASPPRGRHDQVDPPEDHRPGDRLALPERAEEGAERMIGRRTFVSGLALAGAAGLRGLRPEVAWAEPPPETTTLRIGWNPGTCLAPMYAAEELLSAEGFRDVRYVGYK